ncbi:MAG: hypothetical protein LEGION0403_FIIPPAGN_02674 [Legionella sp.]
MVVWKRDHSNVVSLPNNFYVRAQVPECEAFYERIPDDQILIVRGNVSFLLCSKKEICKHPNSFEVLLLFFITTCYFEFRKTIVLRTSGYSTAVITLDIVALLQKRISLPVIKNKSYLRW